MKRYQVVMGISKFNLTTKTNSLRLAKWLVDRKLWRYAHITDAKASDINPPWSKRIYSKERGL